jgi:hypothetical protein
MNIDEFITKYCSGNCDKANHPDCAVSFDGSCAKSRQLKIEIEGASGD